MHGFSQLACRQSLLILLLLMSAYSFSQLVGLGVKFGPNISGNSVTLANGVTGYKTSVASGLVVGIFGHVPIADIVYLRPGLELVHKGSQPHPDENFRYGFYLPSSLLYLDIPLNILFPVKGKYGKYLVGAGPVIGVLLDPPSIELDQTDVGLNLYLGHEWPIGLILSVNYTNGLKNIIKSREYVTQFKNHYGAVSISYLF